MTLGGKTEQRDGWVCVCVEILFWKRKKKGERERERERERGKMVERESDGGWLAGESFCLNVELDVRETAPKLAFCFEDCGKCEVTNQNEIVDGTQRN
ncbi:hypothetical protein RJT34_17362 [Clitoria ternatea]|uniref:Uncharacterized protein n=1 Tax=Clitoria ternatea TaxID=43366 RepID=A0AAN9J985_CLITE